MDLIKAILYGIVLIAGFLAIPVIIAILSVIFGFMAVVAILWFIIRVVKEEPKPPD